MTTGHVFSSGPGKQKSPNCDKASAPLRVHDPKGSEWPRPGANRKASPEKHAQSRRICKKDQNMFTLGAHSFLVSAVERAVKVFA